MNNIPLNDQEKFIIKGEIFLLYSLMANLIKNAVEATPENEIIKISLIAKEDHAVVSIHNKGSVPQTIQKTFFEKYITRGKKHGTGLGTYSAKLIVQTLGGKIFMNSSETEGTNVFFHMPIDR